MAETNTPTNGSTPGQPAHNAGDKPTVEYVTKEDFGKTAAFIRGLNDKLESLAKNVPTMETFVQLGLFEKGEDGAYKPKAVQAPSRKNDQEPEWKAQLDQLQAQIKQRDDALAAERKRAAETEKKSAVISALTKAGAVNPERDYIHIIQAIENGEKGYFARSKDEFGADKQIPLDQAVQDFLKTNPELAKPSGHAGSGTPAGDGTAPAGPGQFTVDYFIKNRDKFRR